jgi:lipopolysaccharide/colanic/teichoic acid biosynthesis glycosyltransferase
MRIPSPASRGAYRFRLGLFDIAAAFACPLAALYLSNAFSLSSEDGWRTAMLYTAISACVSALAFLLFKVQERMPQYFGVSDALEIAKAVLVIELTTCVAVFSLTRLDGIPRSAPIIHGLLLGACLIGARVFVRLISLERRSADQQGRPCENAVVIGATRFSTAYVKLLQSCAPQLRIVAFLDARPEMRGRLVEGIRVVGAPHDLNTLVDEYSVHGITLDRIIVDGGNEAGLSIVEMDQISHFCETQRLVFEALPRPAGLREVDANSRAANEWLPAKSASPAGSVAAPYFRVKPLIDFVAAGALLLLLSPLLLFVTLVVLLDVGSPVLFWQQRVGCSGRNFLLYKFRTLRPPFDWRGNAIPPARRISWIGKLLRDSSLDELPQLLNVLVGDMSLIGPRPLLPIDQPCDARVRLLVRPGISGWAQVNGGKFLTAEEKVALDEWYVRNASIWFDLVVIWRTLGMVFRGARRANETVVGPRTTTEHWERSHASVANVAFSEQSSVLGSISEQRRANSR